MKKALCLILAVCLVATLVVFAACNPIVDGIRKDGTVVIGATSVPHAEILNFAKDILAEQYNLKIEVQEVENWPQLNPSTADGDIYANFFQHEIYLNEYNSTVSEDRQLVSVGAVHVEPLGLYSTETEVDFTQPLVIAITNDVTNQSRALRLLEAQGIITAKTSDNKEIVTVDDFNWGENQYREINAELLASSLPDVDIAVIPGNYALAGKLSSALVTETEEVTAQYANVLVVKKGNENSEITKTLITVLQSQAVKDFIRETYGDAVHAV